MHTDLSLKQMQKEWHGSYKAYLIGFLSSIILTVISFLLVATEWLSGKPLIFTIVGLALLQAVFQLRFFLHLGQEAKPRWETLTFFLMLVLLLIIVLGSLWIMQDLDERVMNMPGMHHD